MGQVSILPITLDMRVDREYELTKSKALFAKTIRDQGYVVDSDSVKQKYFDITLNIKNTSDRLISIWLMKCSFEDNLLVNNNYISITGHVCNGNYPILVKFQSGESKTYKMTLTKSIKFDYPCQYCIYGPQVESTKIGLIVVDEVYDSKLNMLDYSLAMEDKSKWTIVWSNSVKLLDKQPEPKKIKN
jgi:hypothetical protein